MARQDGDTGSLRLRNDECIPAGRAENIGQSNVIESCCSAQRRVSRRDTCRGPPPTEKRRTQYAFDGIKLNYHWGKTPVLRPVHWLVEPCTHSNLRFHVGRFWIGYEVHGVERVRSVARNQYENQPRRLCDTRRLHPPRSAFEYCSLPHRSWLVRSLRIDHRSVPLLDEQRSEQISTIPLGPLRSLVRNKCRSSRMCPWLSFTWQIAIPSLMMA